MALEKEVVNVDLTRALDTRTSGKLVLGGRVTTAQDMQWKGKVMERCNGFAPLGTINTAIPSYGLVAYQRELLLQQQGALSSWQPNVGVWTPRGVGFPLYRLQKTPIYRSATSVRAADVDTNPTNTLTAYCWFDTPDNGTTNNIRVAIVDEGDGSFSTNTAGGTSVAQILSSTANNAVGPKVMYFNNTFMALWV